MPAGEDLRTTPGSYPGVDGDVRFSEDVLLGYRYYDSHQQEPLFPFGHGLSYTTFAIGGLELRDDPAARELVATAWVTNTGQRSGWHVTQLYAGLPDAARAEPRRLVGVAKTKIAGGTRQRVTISVPVRALSVWDNASRAWQLVPGRYTLGAGSSSRSLPVQRTIRLPGSAGLR